MFLSIVNQKNSVFYEMILTNNYYTIFDWRSCNTFFIISLKPFMMGQEHHTRYVAHLIFTFPFIIYFQIFTDKIVNNSITSLFSNIYNYIYPQFTYIYQFINKGQIIDYRSIVHQTNKYKKYSLIVEEQDCFIKH